MEFSPSKFPASNHRISAPFSPSKRHEQETTRGASHSAKRIDHTQPSLSISFKRHNYPVPVLLFPTQRPSPLPFQSHCPD